MLNENTFWLTVVLIAIAVALIVYRFIFRRAGPADPPEIAEDLHLSEFESRPAQSAEFGTSVTHPFRKRMEDEAARAREGRGV